MKKDIVIPKVENVYVVAVKEWNDDFQENTWYAYLVNNTNEKLEMPIVVSRAYGKINGEDRITGTFRHGFQELLSNEFTKIELLENNVLQLSNEFYLTYFVDGKLYDKKFIFQQNGINDNATATIPVMNKRGVFAI